MGRYWNTTTQGTVRSKDEWLTPPKFIERLGPFDLDPCAPINRPWDTAKLHFSENEDGLRQPWSGFVWMNPPYGKGLNKWVEKLSLHGEGIGLIPLRSTDTKWFHNYIWDRASSLLFYKGRIRFWNSDGTQAGSCPHASLLIGYGEKAEQRLRESGIAGKFLKL